MPPKKKPSNTPRPPPKPAGSGNFGAPRPGPAFGAPRPKPAFGAPRPGPAFGAPPKGGSKKRTKRKAFKSRKKYKKNHKRTKKRVKKGGNGGPDYTQHLEPLNEAENRGKKEADKTFKKKLKEATDVVNKADYDPLFR